MFLGFELSVQLPLYTCCRKLLIALLSLSFNVLQSIYFNCIDPGKKETEFLLEAIPLLTELLASKPSAAKHIVAHDAGNYYSEEDRISNMDNLCVGGAFLMLIEYPDRAVRLEFLKLILSLARNSAEVLRYLIEFKFYLAVSTRLEICAHFCEAATADSTFWLELRLLLQVLTTILYECEKFTNELPGMAYMQKVLIMLTNLEPYSMKFMAAKCHAILVNFICDQPSTKDSKVEKSVRRKTTEDTCRVKDRLSVNKHTPDLQTDRRPRKAYSDKVPLESKNSPEPVLSVMDLKGSDDDDDDDIYSDVPTGKFPSYLNIHCLSLTALGYV
ncbi:hypothetical protein J437_LFUL007903 [Ladona fulva]|uniref:Uncharacterized protein n=1 Tax=Ladona fulva TaxID=123851 RepID=A0A8K0P255_LADFU|nr:hypothetical protein J437_LFUL007903 [Ladona fulva]